MHLTKTRIAVAALTTAFSSTALADIKIAVIAPMSGAYQSMGTATRDGAALAAAEINSSGGILGGQKIILVKYDEKGNPELAEKLSIDAVQKEKVQAAIGFANTGVAQRVLPVFQRGHVPLILTPTTGTGLTQTFKDQAVNYIFRNAASDAFHTETLAQYAANVRGVRRPAVFADNTPDGEQGLQQLLASLSKRGISPVLVERFAPGKTDFEDAAIKARQQGADSVITWTQALENAAIKTSLNRIGSRMPVMGSWALSQKTFTDTAGPITYGAASPITFSSDTERAIGQRFVKNYRNYHTVASIPSDMAAAQAYDAVYLFAKAMNSARSTEGKKIVEALENFDSAFVGAVMDYNRPFSPDSHETFKRSEQVFIGVVKNGAVISVK